MAALTALRSESQGLPGLEMHFSNLCYFKVNAGQASLVCLHYRLMSAREVGCELCAGLKVLRLIATTSEVAVI